MKHARLGERCFIIAAVVTESYSSFLSVLLIIFFIKGTRIKNVGIFKTTGSCVGVRLSRSRYEARKAWRKMFHNSCSCSRKLF